MGGMPTEGSTGAAGLGLNKISGTQTKRVVSVIYDASHDFYEGLQSIGRIFYEDANSVSNERIGEPSLNLTNSALPITSNNQFFPLIGELVLVVKTVSNKPVTQRDEHYKNQNYYYPPIRVHNQSSHNAFPFKYKIGNSASNKELKQKAQDGSPNKAVKNQTPTFPLGEYFTDKDIKRLIPFEGDYIIEGRFGNSIRFGATTPFNIDKPIEEQSFPNPWSIGSIDGEDTSDKTKAQIGDPITIIRNGQKVDLNESDSTLEDYLEDINGDHSSIYMCSNQKLIDFQVAGTTTASPPTVSQDSYLIPTGSFDPNPLLTAEDLDFLIANQPEVQDNTFVNTAVGTTGVNPSTLPLPEFDTPLPTDTEFINNQDETEDGLSFYNEMVVESGVVAADHFTVEDVVFTCATTEAIITENYIAPVPGDENFVARTPSEQIADRLEGGDGNPSGSPATSGPAVTGGAADFWSLISICLFEDSDTLGRADVAQAIYNRSKASGYSNGIAAVIKHNGSFEPAFNRGNGGPNDMKTHSTWKAINSLSTAVAACNAHYTKKKNVNYSTSKIEGKLKGVWNQIKDSSNQQKAANLVQGRTDFLSISQGNVATRNASKKAGPNDPTGKRATFVMRSTGKPNNVFGFAYNYLTNKTYQAPTGDFWTKYIPSSWN